MSDLSDAELLALAEKHGVAPPNKPVTDEDLLSLAQKHGINVPTGGNVQGPPTYGYYGTDDKNLNLLQRGEKAISTSGGAKLGLIQPGHEWFSPDAIEGTARYAGAVAAATAGAAAAPVVLPVALAGARAAAPTVAKGLLGGGGYAAGHAILKKSGLLQ